VRVVDDEPPIPLLCRINLQLEGYAVHEATSLDEARRHLDDLPISLVLLDMRIGVERGESLLDELHARQVPVVVVTGSAEVDPSWRSKTVAVMGKPFQIEELLRTVRAHAIPR
jgi:DNA-binding response OmpR family regulator